MKTLKKISIATKAFFNELLKKEEVVKLLGPGDKATVFVYKLDETAIHMHTALGILEERGKEISVLIDKTLDDISTDDGLCAVAILEVVSRKLTHPNELVMATWMVKAHFDRLERGAGRGLSDILNDIFNDIKKRKNEGDK